MLDEEYSPEQVGAYGLRRQPHLEKRAQQLAGTAMLGAGLALATLAAAMLGAATVPLLPSLDAENAVQVALWCSLAMLFLITLQVVAWFLAWREWSGQADYNLYRVGVVSFIVHLLTYVVAIVGMWFALRAAIEFGPGSFAFWMMLLVTGGLVASQIIGGVEYLRKSGPPGTLPGHMRRLVALNAGRNSTRGVKPS